MVLLFWCWLTQVVLEKRPLNECRSSSSSSSSSSFTIKFVTVCYVYSLLTIEYVKLICVKYAAVLAYYLLHLVGSLACMNDVSLYHDIKPG